MFRRRQVERRGTPEIAVLIFAIAALAVCSFQTIGASAGGAGFQVPGAQTSPSQPGPLPSGPWGPRGSPGGPGSTTEPFPTPRVGAPNPLSQRQKDAIVKQSFQKTKSDVAKLSELVQTLQKEINKSNPNVLSLKLVEQASKIEKLAKKIRDEAKSY